jgi:hypothetical protein
MKNRQKINLDRTTSWFQIIFHSGTNQSKQVKVPWSPSTKSESISDRHRIKLDVYGPFRFCFGLIGDGFFDDHSSSQKNLVESLRLEVEVESSLKRIKGKYCHYKP